MWCLKKKSSPVKIDITSTHHMSVVRSRYMGWFWPSPSKASLTPRCCPVGRRRLRASRLDVTTSRPRDSGWEEGNVPWWSMAICGMYIWLHTYVECTYYVYIYRLVRNVDCFHGPQEIWLKFVVISSSIMQYIDIDLSGSWGCVFPLVVGIATNL